VAVAVTRFFSLENVEIAQCLPSPLLLGYRTRVKLAAAADEGGALRLGLFRSGTHEVVDIPECKVASPELLPILEAVRRLAPEHNAVFDLLHVDARWSVLEKRAHLTLVAKPGAPVARVHDLGHALLAALPELKGVALRRAEGKTPRALSGIAEPVCGEQVLWESLAGRRFHLSPGAFFQVDPAAAEVLHAVVRGFLLPEEAGPARHIIDLYAGVGAFALCLASKGTTVTAVESVQAAVTDARMSAQQAPFPLEIAVSTVEDFIPRLMGMKLDRVVVDPPRRGVPMSVLAAIGRGRPHRLAYVACDPETAARDLEVLQVFGLVPVKAVPIDMFGRTDEIETAFCVERAAAPWTPEIAAREADSAVAIKPAVLPTLPRSQGEPNLQEAIRQATGMEDLQPIHPLDVGTSGLVTFARGQALDDLRRAFEAGQVRKEYLALVRGVPRRKGTIRLSTGEDGEEVSRYELLDVVGGYGFIKIEPGSDKRHQIRRHLRQIGHPIIGDERYGDRRTNRYLAEQAASNRLFLHLHRLELPSSRADVPSLVSPLPPELVLVLDRLARR
jgi:23S rRNA (uracil1939-C5)-methyltransferase